MSRPPAHVRALGLALAFTPALVTAALVARFAVDVPTWDDFERAPFLAAWKEGRLGFHDFYALHIEHRIVVPRLLMLPVEVVDRGNCAAWDKPYAERSLPEWRDYVKA